MFSDAARRWATGFLQGTARIFLKFHVTPNMLTFGAFWVVASVSVVIVLGYFQLAGLLLLLTVWFDAVDGTLARMSDQVTPFGAFLDATLDRYAEGILYFGLLVYYTRHHQEIPILLIYLTIVGSLIISYARAKAESVNIPVREGLLTRFERLAILILGLLFNRVEWTLWILAPLTNLTAVQRMVIAWQRSRS